MPPPISSQSALCFGVAARSLGNQASGAETVRPSVRTTLSASALQDTSTAVASLLSTKVLTLFPQKERSVFYNDFAKLGKLVAVKTVVETHCFFGGVNTQSLSASSLPSGQSESQ